ncbi:TPA: hypothetical protein U2D50_001400 [Streptococcus suis]|nr:hypothetical protein [Streptococcus suis]HEM6419312.1 hypothetical protein [Streptococcus suis]HEM6425511.1 hypothetical protein [Streptococcus suis]
MAVRSATNKERTYLDSHCLVLYCGVGARQYFGGQTVIENELKKDRDYWLMLAVEREKIIDQLQKEVTEYRFEILKLQKKLDSVRIIAWK